MTSGPRMQDLLAECRGLVDLMQAYVDGQRDPDDEDDEGRPTMPTEAKE